MYIYGMLLSRDGERWRISINLVQRNTRASLCGTSLPIGRGRMPVVDDSISEVSSGRFLTDDT
jgi:hypothetical protein